MLRLSAENSATIVDIQVINGEGDGDIPFGAELSAFAEALASRDQALLNQAKATLIARAGAAILVDAAAVAANFQRMVRIADATGIPFDNVMETLSGSIAEELDLRRFPSAVHTPKVGWLKRSMRPPLRRLLKFALGRSKPG